MGNHDGQARREVITCGDYVTKAKWKNLIKKQCSEAGTYKPFFDTVIDTLAGVLETRDTAQEFYERTGGNPVVKHTNKGGNTNIVKNPALVVVMDCNAQALTYWKELGLTAKAYKEFGDLGQAKPGTLEDMLSRMGL
jgi:ABC-type enterochelin transport system substrate-binding protein